MVLDFLEKGYGHADEQLFSPVYFDYPELFEHYFGDYQQIITNYKYVHENAESPITLIIQKCFENKNYEKCYEACKYIWKSYCLGKCNINEAHLHELFMKYMYCKTYLKKINE